MSDCPWQLKIWRCHRATLYAGESLQLFNVNTGMAMNKLSIVWVRLWALTRFAIFLNVLVSVNANAEPYTEQWGPPIGEPLPLLEAYDHTGQLRALENLAGERGFRDRPSFEVIYSTLDRE
jgi:hypothetical protein